MVADPVDDAERNPPAACPTCGKPGVQAYRPFCSKRCADVDLQRWFTGRYAIPVTEDDEAPGDASDEDGAGQGGRGSL
jgi:endogenous inhibitor of DNA gyrase (YacG/DUF329 family)